MLQGTRDVMSGHVDHGRLAKGITVWTCIVLTVACLKNVTLRSFDGMDYLWFALGMASAASPSLAREFLSLYFSRRGAVQSERQTSAPPQGGFEK